jgi:outer membrane protein assembly factor BamA
MRARIFSATRDEEGYSKDEIGWRIDLSRHFLPHLEIGAFVEQANVSVSSKGIDPLLLGPTSYFLTSLGLTSSVDYRDDPINPTRGWIVSSAIDLSLIGGEAAFTRFSIRGSYYLPVGKCLLAFGARAGLIEPVSDVTQIPIDVRYFNGGATTVRSFAERELGPKDRGGHPIGGEFYTVLNTEFIFPIVGALRGAVFVDAGNLTSPDDLGFDGMRYAVGVGLRYALPIGPLRLDYGLNPSPQRDEARGAFHFSFGFAF